MQIKFGGSEVLLVVEQIFEWWYFKKYGTSFIEQFTITYLSPLLGGAEPSTPDSDELVPAAPELTVPGTFNSCRSTGVVLVSMPTFVFYTRVWLGNLVVERLVIGGRGFELLSLHCQVWPSESRFCKFALSSRIVIIWYLQKDGDALKLGR